MNRQLTLKPLQGLGNRMGAIASAYSFAMDHEYSLRVVWERNRSVGADFSELFEDLPGAPVIETIPLIQKNILCLDAWLNLYLDENPETIPKPIKRFIGSKFCREMGSTRIYQSEFWKRIEDGSLIGLLTSARNVYLATCWAFGDRQDYSIFRPRPSIANCIDEVRSHFDDHTIGVHIRRSDHKECIQTTSVASFLAAMNHELSVDCRTRFYLATDCVETQKLLVDRFPGKIMRRNADLARSTYGGMADAVIDLFSLASTSKLIANERSTFSSVASQIRAIPLHNPNSYHEPLAINARLLTATPSHACDLCHYPGLSRRTLDL
jgi:hypothetical protein